MREKKTRGKPTKEIQALPWFICKQTNIYKRRCLYNRSFPDRQWKWGERTQKTEPVSNKIALPDMSIISNKDISIPQWNWNNPDESRYTGIRRWDSFILNECNASLPLSTISPSSWSCSEHSHSMDLSGRLSNSLNKLLKGKGRILCNLINVYVVWTHLWTVWVNGMTMVWIGFLKDIGII